MGRLFWRRIPHWQLPNPYFFLAQQSGNPIEYSSDRMNQAPNLSSYKQYLSALDGCCFQRPTTILQPDGIEFVLAIKIDFSDQVGSRSGNQINEYLFADQGVSLKTYYREVSYDQMDVRPGPAEGIMPKKTVGFVRNTQCHTMAMVSITLLDTEN